MEVVILHQEDGQELLVSDAGNSAESDAKILVLKDITSFNTFQETSQLFTSKIIFHDDKKNLQKDDDNDETNKNRTSRDKTCAQGNNEQNNK